MAQKPAPKPVNLTQTSAFLRNLIKVGLIGVVVLMFGRIVLTSTIAYIKALNPPPPPPPTVGFDKLPELSFADSAETVEQFTLETVGQQFPTFGDRAKVFFMPASEPNLFASDNAVAKAAKLGYNGTFQTIDKRTYRWTNSSPILTTLEMDIRTGTFTITSDWSVHPEILGQDSSINVSSLESRLKSMLSSASSISPDISKGPVEVVFLSSLGGEFKEVSSESEAEFVELNMYREPIDEKYGAVTSAGANAPVRGVVTPSGLIVEMEMNAYPVEYDLFETYPIITAQTAWQKLISGQGFIADAGDLPNAIVREVELAYYEPDDESLYYRPVYVFKGDEGFIGYVDAIDPIWIQSDTISQ